MAIAYVSAQSCNGQNGSNISATFTITGGTAVSNGNTICVMASGIPQSGGTVFDWSISDNAGNTYTAEEEGADGGGGGYAGYICLSASGSPTQFTLTSSAGSIQWATLLVDVFSGVSNTAPGIGSNSQDGPGTGTDAITTVNTASSSAGVLWCGMAAWAGGGAAGTGFTLLQKNETTFLEIYSEYQTGFAGGPTIATWTNSTNGGTSGDYFDTIAFGLVPAGSGTTLSPPSASWDWVGNAPKLNAQLLAVQKAWHWQGNAPELNSVLLTVQKAWAWAAHAPTLNFTLKTVQKAWAWAGNAPTLVFQTLIQPPKAMWSWVARAAILSGGNIPARIKAAYNVMMPTIWGVLRGETRDPMY